MLEAIVVFVVQKLVWHAGFCQVPGKLYDYRSDNGGICLCSSCRIEEVQLPQFQTPQQEARHDPRQKCRTLVTSTQRKCCSILLESVTSSNQNRR